jgi:glycosyltransferase involved in cell wall biosynthesis
LENPIPVLQRASAFVLASEYEGFSNSVLEAMFCSVPVITSFCSSDAREMCEQGAALGFNVGDTVQLSEHISAVLTDEALGQRLVTRAREYCALHSVEKAIPIYENLICKVAGNTEQGCQ